MDKVMFVVSNKCIEIPLLLRHVNTHIALDIVILVYAANIMLLLAISSHSRLPLLIMLGGASDVIKL